MTSEEEIYSFMGVEGERICYLGNESPKNANTYPRKVDLNGKHIYPTLTDAHLHLLYSTVLSASNFDICQISSDGEKPDNFEDLEKRVQTFCKDNPGQKIITANGYIVSAIREKRLPNRHELDRWANGKAMIIYTIDGHSSAMSTALMEMLKLDTKESDGIFTGAAHEFMQGKVTDLLASTVTPKVLSRGLANLSNLCASYGISRICSMDGYEDSDSDTMTRLVAFLASRMDLDVRMYPQYMDYERIEPFFKKQRFPRAGGCGTWELDGAVGSHSAAFTQPYKDNGTVAGCYYDSDKIEGKVREALDRGIRLTCHAIGEGAIDQIMDIYEKLADRIPRTGPYMRVDHFEFPSRKAVELIKKLRIALTVQPGFSWVDKRYLHSYEQFLSPEVIGKQLPLKELMAADVCICGSSDSPVQSVNPYDQMLGMTQFYLEDQSLTPYEAMKTYTVNPAKMLGEFQDTGTLETGKYADFFVTDTDIFRCVGTQITSVRAEYMIVRGKQYQHKRGTVWELVKMLLKHPKKI